MKFGLASAVPREAETESSEGSGVLIASAGGGTIVKKIPTNVIAFPKEKTTEDEVAVARRELEAADWRTYVDVRILQLAAMVERDLESRRGLSVTFGAGLISRACRHLMGYPPLPLERRANTKPQIVQFDRR
jgi:hypothetical protein